MTLLRDGRHTPEDMATWEIGERMDAIRSTSRAFEERVARAVDDIASFALSCRCYAGTSWGKDSLVISHMVARLRAERNIDVPLVWVRVEPVYNPDCPRVRDAFLAEHRVTYDEIVVSIADKKSNRRTSAHGFDIAAERHGDAHISGVRGEEARYRRIRMHRWGVSTDRTCAPIGWWSADDVFAYLYRFQLPVHPAYGMLMNGLLDRRRVRVAAIGGARGTGWGRAEWESRYYPDAVRVSGS